MQHSGDYPVALGFRIPIHGPGVFKKDTAQSEDRIESGNVPAHAWSLNACGAELFARALNGPGANEIATLLIRSIPHALLVLLEIVNNRGEAWREVNESL